MKTIFIVTQSYCDAHIEGIFSTPMDTLEKMVLNIENGFDSFSVEEYEFGKRIDFSKDFCGKVRIDFTRSVTYSETYEDDTDFTVEFKFFEKEDALGFAKDLREKYPQGFGNVKSFDIKIFEKHRDEQSGFSIWNSYKEQTP